jgi:hypothetical protein
MAPRSRSKACLRRQTHRTGVLLLSWCSGSSATHFSRASFRPRGTTSFGSSRISVCLR